MKLPPDLEDAIHELHRAVVQATTNSREVDRWLLILKRHGLRVQEMMVDFGVVPVAGFEHKFETLGDDQVLAEEHTETDKDFLASMRIVPDLES